MPLLVPSSEEQKMLIRMNYKPSENNFYGSGGNDQQLLEQWRKYRDYLESPLGAGLLDEINAARRECPVGH